MYIYIYVLIYTYKYICAVYHCIFDFSTKTNEAIQVRLKKHPVDLVGKIRIEWWLKQNSSG